MRDQLSRLKEMWPEATPLPPVFSREPLADDPLAALHAKLLLCDRSEALVSLLGISDSTAEKNAVVVAVTRPITAPIVPATPVKRDRACQRRVSNGGPFSLARLRFALRRAERSGEIRSECRGLRGGGGAGIYRLGLGKGSQTTAWAAGRRWPKAILAKKMGQGERGGGAMDERHDPRPSGNSVPLPSMCPDWPLRGGRRRSDRDSFNVAWEAVKFQKRESVASLQRIVIDGLNVLPYFAGPNRTTEGGHVGTGRISSGLYRGNYSC